MERIVAASSVVLSAPILLTRASADVFTVSAALAWLAPDFVAYRFVLWATSRDLGGAQLLVARLGDYVGHDIHCSRIDFHMLNAIPDAIVFGERCVQETAWPGYQL